MLANLVSFVNAFLSYFLCFALIVALVVIACVIGAKWRISKDAKAAAQASAADEKEQTAI